MAVNDRSQHVDGSNYTLPVQYEYVSILLYACMCVSTHTPTHVQRIRDVEMSSFTPLVFSIFGGMSKLTTVAYKRLADLLSAKRNEPYNQVISWIRIRINLILIRSAVNAIRGYRSRQGRPCRLDSCTLANSLCKP